MDERMDDASDAVADPVDVAAVALQTLHLEQYVQALWPEVVALPLLQRWAFLLHLERDEILVFVQHGCCSLAAVAHLLQMPPEEFVGYFRVLPLPDDRIAARQELTRRQVINLRKCARERLSRRLKVWGEP
jgi:hypothetical protein